MLYVPDVEENAERCACAACPSNPGPDELLHCGRKIKAPEIERIGCFCRSCPVFKSYELSGEYFCESPIH